MRELSDKLTVTTKYNEFTIEQEITYPDFARGPVERLSRSVIDLRERGIRDALTALGWTPPQEHKPYVTISQGGNGFYAVLCTWNEEHGGFYEPYNKGDTLRTREEAIEDAKDWAKAENVEYRA